MTLPERSLFSFCLSLGGGRGFLGWRVARVEKCLNYVLDVPQPLGGVVGSRSVTVRCVRSRGKGREGKKRHGVHVGFHKGRGRRGCYASLDEHVFQTFNHGIRNGAISWRIGELVACIGHFFHPW